MTTSRTSHEAPPLQTPSEIRRPTNPLLKAKSAAAIVVHPKESKPESDYNEVKADKNNGHEEIEPTFHTVVKVIQETPTELRTYYFKKNPSGTAVSELEATAASFYRILAPHHVPRTYAVYNNKNKHIGVISEAIPGFKSTAEDNLEEEDLNLDFIGNLEQTNRDGSPAEPPISLLERLDEELRLLEEEQEAINRKLKLADRLEVKLEKERIKLTTAKPLEKGHNTRNEFSKRYKAHLTNKNTLTNALLFNTDKIDEFYKKIEEQYKITYANLNNYRIVKGLAIGLTSSFIFTEDDLHRNNFSKYGKRIDFDMSLWQISYHYKESNAVWWRKPTDKTFKRSTADISNFPFLQSSGPFYWPANLPHNTTSTTWKDVLNLIAKKIYRPQENSIFRKLKDNMVFKYHTYATLGKYILTNPDIYRQIALAHLGEEYRIPLSLIPHIKQRDSKISDNETISLVNAIVKEQELQICEFENLLLSMPEFGFFFKFFYKDIIKELIKTYKDEGLCISAESEAITEQQLNKLSKQLLDQIVVTAEKAKLEAEQKAKEAEEQSAKAAEAQKIAEEAQAQQKAKEALALKTASNLFVINKKHIINTMQSYSKGLGGFFTGKRNHITTALEFIKFCEALNLNVDSVEGTVAALKILEAELTKTMNTIKNEGGFKKLLIDLHSKVKADITLLSREIMTSFKLSDFTAKPSTPGASDTMLKAKRSDPLPATPSSPKPH